MAAEPTSSPKARSASHSPQAELLPAEPHDGDVDSALGDVEHWDILSSTASVSSSIIEYRMLNGRTYHSERHNTPYYAPNDARQNESVDIAHHYLTLVLGGKLFLAPLEKDKVKRALDVGTGTGIWAIDFADDFPDAEVIGTDLSPTQPTWVPPNVRFEIDDATKPWTWRDNMFDFVHMRYLFGSFSNWTALYKEAFRVTAPGGWIETFEAECNFSSDDGTVTPDSALATWGKLYIESGKKIGRTFELLTLDLQRKGLEEAGYVDIQQVNYKIPIGSWPADPKMAEIGTYSQLALENDMEGYSSFLWNEVMHWPEAELQIFLMRTRKELRNKRIHVYLPARLLYARKPE